VTASMLHRFGVELPIFHAGWAPGVHLHRLVPARGRSSLGEAMGRRFLAATSARRRVTSKGEWREWRSSRVKWWVGSKDRASRQFQHLRRISSPRPASTLTGTPRPLDQAVMCELLTQGHFGRHIRRMRELYGTRLGARREAMHNRCSGLIDSRGIEAGIHVTALLARGLNADAVAAAAAAANVETVPISCFVLATARPEVLLLGFTPYDARQINDAVD
jgi:hypothetical protein